MGARAAAVPPGKAGVREHVVGAVPPAAASSGGAGIW